MTAKKLFRRFISIFLSVTIAISTLTGSAVFADDKTLSLSQAISLTFKNSNKIKSAQIAKVKKEIELKQAYSAVADTRKNESTVRFSLLFNIKFPSSHAMPKEIELLTKIPNVQSELKILNAEYRNAKLSEKSACETQYYDVVFKNYSVTYYQSLLKEAQSALVQVNADYAKGNAKQSDLDYMQKQVENATALLQKAKTQYENAKEKLSSIIGVNVSNGYSFECDLPEVDLNRSDLAQITTYALENDFSYYQARENKNSADSNTEIIKNVYSGRYGNDAANVMNYINSCKARNEPIDYDVFIQKYNSFLSKIDSPWDGSYRIFLLFFSIYIPKEWFKKTYSGSRYLDDQRYALFISLAELDEAEQNRKSAYDTLIAAIREGYYGLNESKAACELSQKMLSIDEKSYKEALIDNRAGNLSFTDLYDKKISLLEQQKNIYEMQIEYAKSISAYDLQTAGFISEKILNNNVAGSSDYEDGITWGEDNENNQPTWAVTTYSSSYKSALQLSIPESYDVTHFELYTDSGKLVGERTAINKSLENINITFADSSLLTLKFYKDDELKYNAVFDGMQFYGTLEMQPAKGGTDRFVAGTWTLVSKGLKTTFSVKSDKFQFDKFELFYKNQLIGSGTNESGVSHLTATFGDMSDFVVKLYASNAEIASLTVISTENNQNLLIY